MQLVYDDYNQQHKVEVACLVRNISNIRIFDIHGGFPDKNRSINFKNNNLVHLNICFSADATKIAFSNYEENYVLTLVKAEDDAIFEMMNIGAVDKKIIYSIKQHKDKEFLYVCSNHYDDDLQIVSSLTDDFKVEIHRGIEPNTLRAFDFCMILEEEEESSNEFPKDIILLSAIDGHFFYDRLNLDYH